MHVVPPKSKSRGIQPRSDAVLEITDELIAAEDSIEPVSIRDLRVLGHGRAAEARLVEVTTRTGEVLTCVEKVFCPGLLTRAIYRAFYQAPFAYQHNADAILACFYRRRVAAAVLSASEESVKVAKPLYVRWDRKSSAWVLASEFISGRGIVPQPTDARMIRRWLSKYFLRAQSLDSPPPEEIETLLSAMTRVEQLLLDSGLTGSGWQVCKRAIVSTANLLRTGESYTIVDLESGIPSILVPAYLRAAFSLGSLPLFDDIDVDKLRAWLVNNRVLTTKKQMHSRRIGLLRDIELLIDHTKKWKASEPAIGRRPTRLFSADFRNRLRERVLDQWQRRELTSKATIESFRQSRRLFLRPTFLFGIIPGKLGRGLQRVCCNPSDRTLLVRFLSERGFRRDKLDRYARDHQSVWRAQERLPDESDGDNIDGRFDLRFMAHRLLAYVTPPSLHRIIADRNTQRNLCQRVWLLAVSRKFQSDFGRFLVQTRIEHWKRSQRLSSIEASELQRHLASPAIDEYIRCFGMHMGLKLLMPLVWSIKVGAAAASLASGNPLFFLATLMLLPVLRTVVTLWRMVSSEHPARDYRDALLIGILPMVGSLAYPVQMHAKFSGFSLFLMRDFASRLGRVLPVYGGPDSRTELMAIKLVNVIAEGLEVWMSLLGSRRCAQENHDSSLERQPTIPFKEDRWFRMAQQQIDLMKQSAKREQTKRMGAFPSQSQIHIQLQTAERQRAS